MLCSACCRARNSGAHGKTKAVSLTSSHRPSRKLQHPGNVLYTVYSVHNPMLAARFLSSSCDAIVIELCAHTVRLYLCPCVETGSVGETRWSTRRARSCCDSGTRGSRASGTFARIICSRAARARSPPTRPRRCRAAPSVHSLLL